MCAFCTERLGFLHSAGLLDEELLVASAGPDEVLSAGEEI